MGATYYANYTFRDQETTLSKLLWGTKTTLTTLLRSKETTLTTLLWEPETTLTRLLRTSETTVTTLLGIKKLR